ncbi:uncharacterized protein EAE98_001810 [Botrytis deweyae]|uniref:NADP-dependent oxidoreductase domain-containing protein n=2 Tax=Botrytis TaxID=33196 RepID=A0A4Z1JYY2_9HELO|nr:uncharacterized protein EAE98_001810 [Botrytis deweyae]KAF7930886.1 hypothetical protein EAE99_004136 [Botrytis elliptica]KAF7937496.1 hypothetical protein EAE98_001810 [Botrytis deweyae]TGO76492.1 hypothetical protein BELL_0152g00020 [Botrytis elliptica]
MAAASTGTGQPTSIATKLFSTQENVSLIGIPQLGFGVYQCKGQKCIDAVTAALRAGYRHIDTAQYYDNEKEVGIAVADFMKKTGIERKEIFITTKILTPAGSVEKSFEKCLKSIEALDTENCYVDLFLIHSPNCGAEGRLEMWDALHKLYSLGKSHMIGVSNFGIGHIEELELARPFISPHVNQIELHPFCQQRVIVQYCKINGIHVEAYCPVVRNQRSNDPVLQSIAATHNKTVAQVLIRYALQKKWIPLPKSETPSRIAENADVFDFNISESDMRRLDALDEGSEGSIVQAVTNR